MSQIDSYKAEIIEAHKKGAATNAIARTLGFPPSTVQNALIRWERPVRPSPGEDALEALRRLVEN